MIIALRIIFFFLLKVGWNQTRGRTSGPKDRKTIINAEVLKYH